MAISMLDNISYLGKKNDTVRSQFNTIEEMKNFNPNYLSDMYVTCCLEDGCVYVYNVANSVDPTTGKWRILSGGTSASLIDYYKKSEIDRFLGDKVDVEEDKGLSTNDYTTPEKEKLASLENYDDTDIKTSITDIQTKIGTETLSTTEQTLSGAINEVKANSETTSSALSERVTNNENTLTILKGDVDVSGSIKEATSTVLEESKLYTDERIRAMDYDVALVVDQKPVYNENDGTITYIKDGVTGTTEGTEIWFYYLEDGKLMQTIWLGEQEMTVVSAGGIQFTDYVSKITDVTSTYNGSESDTSKVPDLAAMQALDNKLKTEIDKKITGDGIVNTLDSNSTTSALSANQGRILNDSINTKLNKDFVGDDVANKALQTNSLGNVVLNSYDDTIDSTSSNAPQTKAVKAELDKKLDILQSVDAAGFVPVVGEDGVLVLKKSSALGGSAELVSYTNDSYPDLSNVALALDTIIAKIYYEAPRITSFTMTPSKTEYEIGSSVSNLTFDWTINKAISGQTLTDCTITVDDRSATYNNELSATKTFTLTVSDGEKTTMMSKKISFLNPIYFGCCAEPTEYNNAFIFALGNSKLVSSNKGTYNFDCGSGEYAYFATPTSMAISSAWVNGFQADLQSVAVISHTNSSGYTSSYTISRFSNSGLGSFSAEVK